MELRKSKRNDQTQKRRTLAGPAHPQWTQLDQMYPGTFTEVDLPRVLEATTRGTDSDVLFAAQAVRKMLSIRENPPIQQVIDSGLVSILMLWLQRYDITQLQYEACWALTNIASGSQAHAAALVNKGIIPLVYQLLSSEHEDVREQAVWLIGNLAGDSPGLRDAVLQTGGLDLVLKTVQLNPKQSLIKNGSWAVSNLCRGKPAPKYDLVSPAVPYLAQVIASQEDPDLLQDCCWALSQMCEGSNERIQTLLDTGILPRITALVSSSSYKLQLPAVRIIGNVASGNSEQTDKILELGFVPTFKVLLASPKLTIRKEAAWTISNMAAGSKVHVQSLVYNEIFIKLLEILPNESQDTQSEILWAVHNGAVSDDPDVLFHLLQIGSINVLCGLLESKSSKIVYSTLDLLAAFLEAGSHYFTQGPENKVCTYIEQCGGLNKIEGLQKHENQQIYKKALKILESYFEVETPNDDLCAAILSVPAFQF